MGRKSTWTPLLSHDGSEAVWVQARFVISSSQGREEGGRSKGTKGAAIFRTSFQDLAGEPAFLNSGKACCVCCQDKTKKHNGEQEQKSKRRKMKLSSTSSALETERKSNHLVPLCSTWYLCLAQHTYICSIVFSCHNKTDEITPLKVRVNPLHGPWKRPKLTETYYKGVRIDTTSCFYHNFTLHANNRGLNLFFSLSLYFPPEEHHHSGNKDTEHQC